MIDIPDDIDKLIDEYIKKKGKKPRPWNYDEWDSFEQYKNYLQEELNK